MKKMKELKNKRMKADDLTGLGNCAGLRERRIMNEGKGNADGAD